LARVKAIERNAAALDAESYRPELIGDDEPRYLRRQRPVEIRRKKFSGRSWPFYKRVMVWSAAGIAGVVAAVIAGKFLLYSPQMLLLKFDQVEINGNHVVTREAVLQQFTKDRSRSVVTIPLDTRRSAIEELPWVESASVQRILPNRLRVDLTERTPIAFLRNGTELALIDAHGVILDRPQDQDLHFPIVTGLPENMPREEREKRMEKYQDFIKDIDLVRSGSSDDVSEIDLADPRDLKVVMTGISSANDSQALTIHFGSGDYTAKYEVVIKNFAQWQASNGHVQSLDLRYSRQVILNPDTTSSKRASKNK
jgi:cell division protein FtsQ